MAGGILDFWSGANAPGGLLDSIGQGVSNNSGALMMGGMGMLSGHGMQDGFQNAMAGLNSGMQNDRLNKQMRAQAEEKARQRAALQAAAKNLGLDPALAESEDALRLMIQKQQSDRSHGLQERQLAQGNSTADIREYEYAKREGFKGTFPEFIQQKRASGSGLGMTPIWGTRDGKPVILQMGQGQAVEAKLPDGVELSSGFDKIDLGTSWGIVDKRTGQVVQHQPKDIAGAAAQREIGEAQGQREAKAPQTVAVAQQMLNNLEALKNHPAKNVSVGVGGVIPGIPNTAQKDFVTRFDQVKGQAFLQAFETLKGGGQITEREGQAATAAITRLNRATKVEDFDAAIDELAGIVRGAMSRQPGAAGQQTQQPARRKYNHQTGRIE